MVGRYILIAVLMFICLVPTASAASTQVVKDQIGRSVRLPAKVQRIIPMGGATRLVVYMQAFYLVAGLEAMESRQPLSSGRPYNMAIRKQAETLPIIGEGRQKPVNAEAIIAVRPDLIISTDLDVSQADRLQRMTGVPVLVLDYGGTGVLDLEKVKSGFRLLGKVLGRGQRADQLATALDRQQKELAELLKDVTAVPVYIGAVSYRGSQGITSTSADYFPLQMARAVNLADGLKRSGNIQIDKEQLLVWNPPVILVDAGGEALVRQDLARNRSLYDQLDAFRNGHVYRTLPYNYYHTNLELALANSWYIASLLHPEQLAKVDPARKTDELCMLFNNITCYQQLKQEFGGFGRLPLQPGQGQKQRYPSDG